MTHQLLSSMLQVLPWWFALIPPVGLLAATLKAPRVKGWIGEMLLHQRLRIGLDRTRYHLFHNLILPTTDGTTQVDHAVVSVHGIFVIETKNYAGWIFGSERDRVWTQKFRRRSHSFQNPLRQNYKHVRALAELTGLDDRMLFSLVAFVGGSTFKTPMPDNVTRAGGCLAAIRARTEVLLSEAELEAVIARIGEGRVAPSRAANAAHARHVQGLVAQRQDGTGAHGTRAPDTAGRTTVAASEAARSEAAPAAAAPCCPRCGGALGDYTFRSGARAGRVFRGCARFPECGYRVDLPAPAASESAATPA